MYLNEKKKFKKNKRIEKILYILTNLNFLFHKSVNKSKNLMFGKKLFLTILIKKP